MDMFLTTRGYSVARNLSEHIWLTKCNRLIVCARGAKINIAYVSALLQIMLAFSTRHAIVVHDHMANTSVANILKDLRHFVRIELIQKSFLYRSLLTHTLVPKHTLATAEEVQHLGKATCSKLPVILHTDPVVRYHDWAPQAIIRIDRADGAVAYRIVK